MTQMIYIKFMLCKDYFIAQCITPTSSSKRNWERGSKGKGKRGQKVLHVAVNFRNLCFADNGTQKLKDSPWSHRKTIHG